MYIMAMEQLEFFEDEKLLRYFRYKRTELSCLEHPTTFLNQLRDYKLILEQSYKTVLKKRDRKTKQKSLYDVLDRIEKEQPQHIKLFWSCVFADHLLAQYPSLRLMRNSLLDGSYELYNSLPEDVEEEGEEEEENKKRKQKKLVENEEENGGDKAPGKKRRKTRHTSRSGSVEEEPSGSSSEVPPGKRKGNQKPTYSSPLKKGERKPIWTWPLYKTHLPITCGATKGTLNRVKLAEGVECIQVKERWFTPDGFEAFAGKAKCRNWKLSIRCMDTTLAKLINEGHLQSGQFQRRKSKVKRTLSSTKRTESDGKDGEETGEDVGEDPEEDRDREEDSEAEEEGEEREEEEEAEEEGEARPAVFSVTCGGQQGTLHRQRFASGEKGLSVRTENRWMTPVDFMKEGLPLGEGGASWRKAIQWGEKPLSYLIETGKLQIHSLLCRCRLCSCDTTNLEDQKNDDYCFVCGSDGARVLVECDRCPRSFHQRCHLPNVTDDIIEAEADWFCTFCVLKACSQCRYPRQHTYNSALSCDMSKYLMECQYLLLCLYNADQEKIVFTNPDAVPGYSGWIRSPMWLDLVCEKLQRNDYPTVRPFFTDVELIFSNCATFNRNNAQVKAMGGKLKQLFRREFKNVFSILDRSRCPTNTGNKSTQTRVPKGH